MKWYRISWQEHVAVEIPRPLDSVRWWPWWLRRPSRFVDEWQGRSMWIEADRLIDVGWSTLYYGVRHVQFEEVTEPGHWSRSKATVQTDSDAEGGM